MDDEDAGPPARAPEPEDVVRICRALNDAGARYLEGVLREREAGK